MKILNSKNITIGQKLFISYTSLILAVILISGFFTAPLVGDLVEKRIKNELESNIDLFHSLVQTSAELSIKNHLRTIVETNIEFLDVLNSQIKSGEISDKQARNYSKSFFTEQTIGKTGYIYTLSSDAEIVNHPKKSLINRNVYNNAFVKEMVNSKDGYIEYMWQNPDDEKPRKKALYFIHYKPWDLIIAASSYKSEFKNLLEIKDLRQNIQNLEFGKSGYAFIIDTDGNILLHPRVQGRNIKDIDFPQGISFVKNIKNKNQGKVEYSRTENGKKHEKLIYFKYLEPFELIICASGYKKELYGPVYGIIKIFSFSLIILLLCFIPLTIWLSRSITKPLETFIEKIKYASRGNLNVRIPSTTSGEVGKLARYFNIFMEELSHKTKKLESEIEERKSRENQIRILAKFPDDNPNPVLRVNRNHTISFYNEASEKHLKTINLKIGIKLPDLFTDPVEKAFKTNTTQEIEYIDEEKTFSFTISPFEDIHSAYIYGKEITAQKEYESLKILSEAFFMNSIEGICITDKNADIIRINPFFTEITGYTEEEVIGKNPKILKSDKHDAEFYRKMWQSIIHTGQWSGEIWNRRKNGQAYPEGLLITVIKDINGKPVNYIGIFHDITESIINKEKIHYQTYHDATTGLPNRKLFADIVEQKINFSRKNKDKFALIFIDINNFKNINDTLGHVTGDNLLYQLADNLKKRLSEDKVIARFVGDKFIILVPDAENQNYIMKQASGIQKIINGPYVIDEREIFCGSNIGVSFFPDDGDTAEFLIKNAEMAMYRGKNKGKRGISFFTASMDETAAERLETEQNLASALVNNEFELYFQPKVNLYTGRISGAEALIRWIKNGSVISPGLFIPVAEETGHIIPIGEWVMETAFKAVKKFHDAGYKDLTISVNLSGVQFQEPDLLEKIKSLISQTGADPEYVIFEITESVVMSDPALATEITKKIKDIGSRISIDDFGTGYSSLGYLKKFPVDELKIDKSFLDDFPDSNEDISIVKSILSLASNLDLHVTAEGVESKIQADMLKALKCDEMQGFYFSKPLTESSFFELLASGKSLKEIKKL